MVRPWDCSSGTTYVFLQTLFSCEMKTSSSDHTVRKKHGAPLPQCSIRRILPVGVRIYSSVGFRTQNEFETMYTMTDKQHATPLAKITIMMLDTYVEAFLEVSACKAKIGSPGEWTRGIRPLFDTLTNRKIDVSIDRFVPIDIHH